MMVRGTAALWRSAAGSHLAANPFHNRAAFSDALTCVSWGYFAADLVALLAGRRRVSCAMLAHHLVGVTAPVVTFSFGVASWFLLFRGAHELSTPFLHLRAILKQDPRPQTPLRAALLSFASAAFAVLFVCSRVLPIPVYWLRGYRAYHLYRAPFAVRWGLFALGMLMDALNVWWSYLICRSARQRAARA
jgi:hypothetical protein